MRGESRFLFPLSNLFPLWHNCHASAGKSCSHTDNLDVTKRVTRRWKKASSFPFPTPKKVVQLATRTTFFSIVGTERSQAFMIPSGLISHSRKWNKTHSLPWHICVLGITGFMDPSLPRKRRLLSSLLSQKILGFFLCLSKESDDMVSHLQFGHYLHS